MRAHRTPPTRLLLAAIVTLAAVAAACTGAPPSTPVPSTPPASVTPVPGDIETVPQGILDAVLADAATRTGSAVDDIVVLTAKAVTWPDGALGCPQPGFMYTQALEPGYQVVLDATGTRLDYRTGSAGMPILCENPPASG